jgi:hypothetical protein
MKREAALQDFSSKELTEIEMYQVQAALDRGSKELGLILHACEFMVEHFAYKVC